MKIKVTRTFVSGVQRLERSAEAEFETEIIVSPDPLEAAEERQAQLQNITDRTSALFESLNPK